MACSLGVHVVVCVESSASNRNPTFSTVYPGVVSVKAESNTSPRALGYTTSENLPELQHHESNLLATVSVTSRSCWRQAQGVLWDATVVLEDRLRDIEAQMRELVCRRYRPADLRLLEAGEGGDAEEVSPLEDPAYEQHFQSMR
jgi:hypothetical protein